MAITKDDVYDQLDRAVLNGANPFTISCRAVWRSLGETGSLETISKHKKTWLAAKHPGAVAPAPAPAKRPVTLLPSDAAKLRMLLANFDQIELMIEEFVNKKREERERHRR